MVPYWVPGHIFFCAQMTSSSFGFGFTFDRIGREKITKHLWQHGRKLMNLFQIQPEVKGEWYTVGFIHGNLISVDHLTVYDTAYPSMNVTIGFMSRHVDLAQAELETMMEFKLFPVLSPGKIYHIPDTQWAVKLR